MNNFSLILLVFNLITFINTNYSQWYLQEPSIRDVQLNSILFSVPNNGLILGTKGTILHSSDFGFQWTQVESNTTLNLNKSYFIDGDNGWLIGDSGLVMRTFDGGLNWSKLDNEISLKLFSVFFSDSSVGFISAKNSIYKTTNSGLDWEQKHFDQNAEYYAVKFLDTLNGFAAGDSSAWGVILKTSDGGNNWFTVYREYFGFLSDISFPSQSVGYISGENSVVLKTIDGGNNWERLITINAGEYDWQSVYFVDENIGWVCGWRGAILNTTDGGLTWIEQRPEIGNFYSLNSIFFIDSLTGWTVGHGYDSTFYAEILKTTNGGVTSINDDENVFTTQYFLEQNYPNPFNPSTVIRYQIPESGLVSLKVYDLLGREITTLVDEHKPAGSYDVKFDGSKLSSGVYIYQIKSSTNDEQAGNYMDMKKMILIK